MRQIPGGVLLPGQSHIRLNFVCAQSLSASLEATATSSCMFLTGAAQNYFVLKLADDVRHLDVCHIKSDDFSVASDKFFRPQGWHPFGSSFSYLVCSSCSSSPGPSRTCHLPTCLVWRSRFQAQRGQSQR